MTSVAVVLAMALLLGVAAGGRAATQLPPGFQETTVIEGLNFPTVTRFAPDGRVFVAEKSGLIKVYDGIGDGTPTVFADLRSKVHDFWDRGMLGLALDPQFSSSRPYVYVLYTYDAPIGGTAPTWGDGCTNPPGATEEGCVVSARLSKLTAAGDVMAGSEDVLINDWCAQYPSHTVGGLAFGPDGALYASGGSGLFRVEPTTGEVVRVASLPRGTVSAGDVAFFDDRLFVTVGARVGRDVPSQLAEVDLATATSRVVGPLGYDCIWGLAPLRDVLYGLSCGGAVIEIDVDTGASTFLARPFGFEFWGASSR
jgi:hypothetical protein